MRTASASRKRNKAYCLALAWLLALNTVFGQDTATADQLQRLDTLKTHTQLYCYSPGQQERAATIAVFLEEAVKYFQEEIAFTPQTVFYILSPQHWKQYAATPFHE
ncbi:MAG TPA: hypothetical protein VF145_08725, partial [Chitinophagaceae bacterium]